MVYADFFIHKKEQLTKEIICSLFIFSLLFLFMIIGNKKAPQESRLVLTLNIALTQPWVCQRPRNALCLHTVRFKNTELFYHGKNRRIMYRFQGIFKKLKKIMSNGVPK